MTMQTDTVAVEQRYAALGQTSTSQEGPRWYIWKSGHDGNYVGGHIANQDCAKAIAAELNRLAALQHPGGGVDLSDHFPIVRSLVDDADKSGSEHAAARIIAYFAARGGTEPRGCPTPGACSCPSSTSLHGPTVEAAIYEAMRDWRLTTIGQEDEPSEGYPLVDAVSEIGGDISSGEGELREISHAIASALGALPIAAGEKEA